MTQTLAADCANCFALCCTALAFQRSSDFAFDKAAGQPCRNLLADFGCGIHAQLRDRGMKGCTVYDCFGAGQKVSQQLFNGVSWREAPETSREMFAVFPVVRQLHELLWYLREAAALPAAAAVANEIAALTAQTEAMTLDPGILSLDVAAHHDRVAALLLEASELARSRHPQARNLRGADLLGADLHLADLTGANLRGALLIAADLRGATFTDADLVGADLRDARLHGADLSRAMFLTQPQVGAAHGDSATLLPEALTHPPHWI
ncbi:MAG: pentapeptide repeat-containing protein [Rhodoglobus sp.]